MPHIRPDIDFILKQVPFAFAGLNPVWPTLPEESGSCTLVRQSNLSGGPNSRTTRSIRVVPRLPEDPVALIASVSSFTRDAKIYGESEPADGVHMVISGTVRTYRMLSDGRRQIGAFYLPGDMFGLELEETRQCAAAAVTHASLLIMQRRSIRRWQSETAIPLAAFGRLRRVRFDMLRTTPSFSPGALGNVSRPFSWRWPNAFLPAMCCSCRCPAWTLPTTWASPWKRYAAR